MVLQRNLQPNSPPQVNMVCTNHGSLPIAAVHGHSPPPYTFLTGNLNFLPKNWSKSVVMAQIRTKMLLRTHHHHSTLHHNHTS